MAIGLDERVRGHPPDMIPAADGGVEAWVVLRRMERPQEGPTCPTWKV
jgi:hypothetical protein